MLRLYQPLQSGCISLLGCLFKSHFSTWASIRFISSCTRSAELQALLCSVGPARVTSALGGTKAKSTGEQRMDLLTVGEGTGPSLCREEERIEKGVRILWT